MMKLAAMAVGVVVLAGLAQIAPAADGKAVYTASCGACHNAMQPKLGDKKTWEPRLKLGEDTLVASVMKGKGAMPPKGGKSALSEADVKAAVEYMMEQVK